MLELNKSGRRISFGKQINIVDGINTYTANVKYLIYSKELGQTFIVTDDFLVVCKYKYGGNIDILEKYIFIPLPDSSDYFLSYYMILGIPIYSGKTELDKIELFGYTHIKDNIIDENRETATIN